MVQEHLEVAMQEVTEVMEGSAERLIVTGAATRLMPLTDTQAKMGRGLVVELAAMAVLKELSAYTLPTAHLFRIMECPALTVQMAFRECPVMTEWPYSSVVFLFLQTEPRELEEHMVPVAEVVADAVPLVEFLLTAYLGSLQTGMVPAEVAVEEE